MGIASETLWPPQIGYRKTKVVTNAQPPNALRANSY